MPGVGSFPHARGSGAIQSSCSIRPVKEFAAMKRVTGIGGIFIKSARSRAPARVVPEASRHRRRGVGRHRVPLGGAAQSRWPRHHGVERLRGVVQLLRAEHGAVHGELPRRQAARAARRTARGRLPGRSDKVEESEFGKFGWVRRSGRQQDRTVGTAAGSVRHEKADATADPFLATRRCSSSRAPARRSRRSAASRSRPTVAAHAHAGAAGPSIHSRNRSTTMPISR